MIVILAVVVQMSDVYANTLADPLTCTLLFHRLYCLFTLHRSHTFSLTNILLLLSWNLMYFEWYIKTLAAKGQTTVRFLLIKPQAFSLILPPKPKIIKIINGYSH